MNVEPSWGLQWIILYKTVTVARYSLYCNGDPVYILPSCTVKFDAVYNIVIVLTNAI